MKVADAAGVGWEREFEFEEVAKRIRSGLNKLHDEYDPGRRRDSALASRRVSCGLG
jgi:hypothetical protein